jgi:hypothetical protein
MNDYTKTQRVDDFKVGQKVVVRDADNIFVQGQDTVQPGEVYTVEAVKVVNPYAGTGQLRLAGRSDGSFNGAFGHLLFDHCVAVAPVPIKSADVVPIGSTVRLTERYSSRDLRALSIGQDYIVIDNRGGCLALEGESPNGESYGQERFDLLVAAPDPKPDPALAVGDRVKIKDGAGHEAFHGRTGVIASIDNGRLTLTLDNPPTEDERMTDDPNGGYWMLSSIERTTEGWENDLMPPKVDIEDEPVASDGDLKAGDRVEIVGCDTTARETRKWDGPGVVKKVYGDWIHVRSDGHGYVGAFLRENVRPLVDAPDLSNADVRKGLPIEDAYPVGSVWNHISTGDKPVTITGPDPDDDRRVMVQVPEHFQQSLYTGSWIRGALDTYGTLVSLPDEAEDDLTAALDHQKQRVVDLEAEINMLKQAAADERRRLCSEIDDLKTERDALVETRNKFAEDRAKAAEEIRDLKGFLASSQDRANGGWNLAAKQQAALDFADDLLGPDGQQRVADFVAGWEARDKD